MEEITYHLEEKVTTYYVLEKFGDLIYPDLRKRPMKTLPELGTVILAAESKKAVGILFAAPQNNHSSLQILAFAVHPKYQNQGIGQNLVQIITSHCSERSLEKIFLYYRSHWKGALPLGIILAKNQWSEPELHMVIVDGLASNVLQLFSKDEQPYPQGYSTIAWKDMSISDHTNLRNKFADSLASFDQNPYIAEETINLVCSLVLKFNSEIVGWVVSHVISPVTNEFTSYYLLEGHRNFRLAHKLMRETIFLQHEKTEQERFIIVSRKSNRVMSRFLLRHAEKTKVKLIKTMLSEKSINKI